MGRRNDVLCVSIEHKLAPRPSFRRLAFGDCGGGKGGLVGWWKRGLEYMFIMMRPCRACCAKWRPCWESCLSPVANGAAVVLGHAVDQFHGLLGLLADAALHCSKIVEHSALAGARRIERKLRLHAADVARHRGLPGGAPLLDLGLRHVQLQL